MIREPGRALSAADVAAAVGAPVIAQSTSTPRSPGPSNAGLLATRLHPSLDAGLAAVALLGAFGNPQSVTRPGDAVANAAEPDPPEVSAW